MEKKSFFDILTVSTPEQLNEFISKHGKKKMTNAVSYLKKEDDPDEQPIEHRSTATNK